MNTNIFQTLRDKNNHEKVLKEGPFVCSWDNTWLGVGYYFWDTFIESAHFWGKVKGGKYIITKGNINFTEENCLDLYGNLTQLNDFIKCYELMEQKGLGNSKTTVARVIEFMKSLPDVFQYSSIRCYGINTRGEKTRPNYRMLFEESKRPYLVMKPAIQFCLINLDIMDFKDYEIVFPYEYSTDYLI